MEDLLLAPYSQGLQLGQGFNSFLHEPCIARAVDIPERNAPRPPPAPTGENGSPSQTVTYSFRFVDRISDVTSTMNLSAATAIRLGGAGTTTRFSEDKLAASDINALVSVKVVHTTLTAGDEPQFVPLVAVEKDPSRFLEVYGDSYISGFQEGGEFHGLVSVNVSDRSKRTEVRSFLERSIRHLIKNGNPRPVEGNSASTSPLASGEVETTISANWSGGGFIKPQGEDWTLDSLLDAVAAFPGLVQKVPQRTRVILTPYDKNSSYAKWASDGRVILPDFGRAQKISNSLLDDYMGHKRNTSLIQAVMADPEAYKPSKVKDAMPIDVGALAEERMKIRKEMRKYDYIIDGLNKNELGSLNFNIEGPTSWACRLPVLQERVKTSNGTHGGPSIEVQLPTPELKT